MSAHRYSSDARAAYSVGTGARKDVSEGDTIDLYGKSGVYFEISGTGGSAVTLPAEENVPVGTTLFIVNDGTGNLVVENDAAATIATIGSTAANEFILSEDDSGPLWLRVAFSNGLT